MSPLRQILEILERDVVEAAPALLGWELVRGAMRASIVEAEAYSGVGDPGCHAFRGQTPRNSAMFGPPGRAYVYFTYGNHWMLNVAADREGIGSAVLIRAAKPLSGQDEMATRRPRATRERDLLSGPGKLTAAFGIDRALYGIDLLDPSSELHIEPGKKPTAILVGKRIGLTPGMGDELPWRFVDEDNLEWASRPTRTLTPLPAHGPNGS